MIRQSLRSEKRNRAFIKAALLVAAFLFGRFCAHAEVTVPDTPAGHTLQAFLDAFDSGDHDRIAAYVKEYDSDNSANGLTTFSRQTGGFTLTSIVQSTPDRLTFLVHGRGDNVDAYGVLQLASTVPRVSSGSVSVRFLQVRSSMTSDSMLRPDRRPLTLSARG